VVRVTDTRVDHLGVLEGLSGLEGARQEGAEKVGQPGDTARLVVVQGELPEQPTERPLDLLLVGVREGVPINIRQDEGFRDVIILVPCLSERESSLFLP
jgi:hypothetical protein